MISLQIHFCAFQLYKLLHILCRFTALKAVTSLNDILLRGLQFERRKLHSTVMNKRKKKKKKKGKAITETGCGGPLGCETLRVPHFLDNRLTDGGEAVSLTC
jgi:hypothetical protein